MIHHRRTKEHYYAFLLNKMRKKLSGWKASSLSFAGHVMLAQASVRAIPCYIMQTSLLPASIYEEADKICRDFIWGSSQDCSKRHLVSWEKTCKPENEGGLDFQNLHALNEAYMMKLGWKMIVHPQKLWVEVMQKKNMHVVFRLFPGWLTEVLLLLLGKLFLVLGIGWLRIYCALLRMVN